MKKSNCNPFNSYYFHENIFKINIIYKKRNYIPIIFCIYDDINIVAILPLEIFYKALITHGSEFVDYEGIIFDESVNSKFLAEYLNKICLKNMMSFQSIDEENNL